MLSFSPDGSHLATRYDCTPTTVWIWNLRKSTASGVVLCHAPVKQFSWHPSISSLLLIHCLQDEPIFYLFDTATCTPTVNHVPFQRGTGRLEARWLPVVSDADPAILFSDAKSFLVVRPLGREHEDLSIIQEEFVEGDESLDSVYQVLTGRSPFKGGDTEFLVSDVVDETSEIMEDTFHARRQLSSAA
jgi:WD40 repeat protein